MLLALDLAGDVGRLGLARPDGGAAWRITEHRFGGDRGRMLVPALDAFLREEGVAREMLRGVVVGIGPGSYTGLRIAASAARALGHALGIPVGGVCGMAAAGLRAPVGSEVHVLQDAFRGETYHLSLVRHDDDVVEVVSGPQVLGREEARARVGLGQAFLGDPSLAGDGARMIDDSPHPFAADLLRFARSRGVGLDGSGFDALEAATPLYLRPAAVRRG